MMYVIFYVEAYVAREYSLREKLFFLKPEVYENGRWEDDDQMKIFRYIAGAREPRKFDGDSFYYSEYDLRFTGEVAMDFDSGDALTKLSDIVSQLGKKHITCRLQIETK